jgi:SAM-dependent methyltransferase
MVDDLEFEVAARFAEGARVLELGCGTGLILERIAAIAKAAVGIDLSERMAQRARERGLEVRLGSVCALPFADEQFDLTYAFKVFPHVEDIERAIREAMRVTRPGGHLLFEFYNPWSLRYLAKRVAGPSPIGEKRTEADVYTRWDSPRAIRNLIPRDLDLLELRGVRVFTPFAAVHRLPGLGAGLRWAERSAGGSPLRYFGGFIIAVLRKR